MFLAKKVIAKKADHAVDAEVVAASAEEVVASALVNPQKANRASRANRDEKAREEKTQLRSTGKERRKGRRNKKNLV